VTNIVQISSCLGGIYGVVEGWKGAANSNYKIRFNSVMNAFSKRGSALGNSLAIIGKIMMIDDYDDKGDVMITEMTMK